MIDHVTGQLVDVLNESVVVDRSGIGYRVSVPQYAVGELAACRGKQVTLHTLLFLDGGHTSSQLDPQLVGFPHAEDKAFFKRFVSVKGVGWRKALRALTYAPAHVASWIERGDATSLRQLPGIGSRAAELIVAELKGKLTDFALAGVSESRTDGSRLTPTQRDALEVMIALGDGRADAEQWLERAAQINDVVDSPDEWIRAAYRVKTGVHG